MSENMAIGLMYDLDKIDRENIISKVNKYFNENVIDHYLVALKDYEKSKKRVRAINSVLDSSAKDIISSDELSRLQRELKACEKMISNFDKDDTLFEWLDFNEHYNHKDETQRIISIIESILSNDETNLYSLINNGRWRFSTVIRVVSYFIPVKFVILNNDLFNRIDVAIVKDGEFKLGDSIQLDLSFSSELQQLIDSVK